MPSTNELIENFNTKYTSSLNPEQVNDISSFINRTMTGFSDNATRDDMIRGFIVKNFRRVARAHERAKVEAHLVNPSLDIEGDTVDFFKGYVEIIRSIAKDTSEAQVEAARLEQERVKAEAEAARETVKNLTERLNDLAGQIKNQPKKMSLKQAYVDTNAEKKKAETILERKEKLEQNPYTFTPYEEGEQLYFGITSKDLENALTSKSDGMSYRRSREFQIKKFGVKSPLFQRELEAVDTKDVTYATSSDDMKKNLQEIYVTKTLMEEKLKTYNWFWRIVLWGQARAMENYINAANAKLNATTFDAAAISDANDMASSGYLSDKNSIDAFLLENKTELDKNDVIAQQKADELERQMQLEQEQERLQQEKLEEERRKSEELKEKLNESAKKNDAKKEEFERVSKLPLEQQFLELNFRPAITTTKALHDMREAFVKVYKQYVKDNPNASEATKKVLEITGRKFAKAKVAIKAKDNNVAGVDYEKMFIDQCIKFEDEYEAKFGSEKPMTIDQLKASLKTSVNIPNEEIEGPRPEVSKPQEELSLKKEPLKKDNVPN